MNTREEIKKLWRESFNDSDEFVDMFFSRVYNDDDALLLTRQEGGAPVSAMLLQRYRLKFHDSEPGLAYVCGAATRRSERGKGHMSTLMIHALEEARSRGDAFCALIPAHSWLYPYYSRFGFRSVFLVRDDRYTALHPFNQEEGGYEAVDNPFDETVYEAFTRLEHLEPCRVLHSRRDFLNILDDVRLDGGAVAIIASPERDGRIVAMAWGVERDGMVRVTELLGETEADRIAALRRLRRDFPGLPFTVGVVPRGGGLDNRRRLSPRGMCRVVNVLTVLEAIAQAHPRWRSRIRVTDRLLSENSHFYVAAAGRVTVDDECTDMPDLDIDIETFTSLVFSSPEIGSITGLPSVRPAISLMLD